MRNNKGFTLLEMIVAMGIFMTILIMASYGFERVLTNSSQQGRSIQSNFEGVAGLEMLRYDVEHAGYGLAWGFENYTGAGAIHFRNLGGTENKEVAVAANVPMPGMDATALNAVYTDDIKAITAGTSTKEANGSSVTNAGGGPDYLVLRSTVSALDDSSRKWNYLTYSNFSTSSINSSSLHRWDSPQDLTSADRFITLKSTFTTDGQEKKVLLMDGDEFEVNVDAGGAMPTGASFKPTNNSEVVVAYGVRSASASALRMPYNRTDYYVYRPSTDMPQQCNPGTGILFKTMAEHGTGAFGPSYPLLDCVADMQVEFEYDANDNGTVSYDIPSVFNARKADEIRSHLKNVRIYILVHEGKMDRGYSYPLDSIHVGDSRRNSSGRTFTSSDMASLFTADWRKYRWKLYTMVIRPKNLGK